MLAFFAGPAVRERVDALVEEMAGEMSDPLARRTDDLRATAPDLFEDDAWPLPNVWCGCSIATQEDADRDIPVLLSVPAALRFVSYEPALGPMLLPFLINGKLGHIMPGKGGIPNGEPWFRDADGDPWSAYDLKNIRGVDQVIVGGESGRGARPFCWQWALDVVHQCRAAKIACFVKQFGSNPVSSDGAKIILRNRKGSDPAEWLPIMRVREFPVPYMQGEKP